MEEKKYSKEDVIKFRNEIENMLKNNETKGFIKLNIPKDFFNDVLFIRRNNYKLFALPFDLMKKLDLSDADFSGVGIYGLDFKDSYGVKINPQLIRGTVFEHGDVLYWNGKVPFKVAKYADKDTIEIFVRAEHALINCNLENVTFTGPFDNTLVSYCNFAGSHGAVINPEKLVGKIFRAKSDSSVETIPIKLPAINCNFKDVAFQGEFKDHITYNSDFTGSIMLNNSNNEENGKKLIKK